MALLLLMLVMTVGAASVMLSARNPAQSPRTVGSADDAVALARARDALLARALSDQNRPGSLPCAAQEQDGKGMFSGGSCITTFKYFPHHTLEMAVLRTSDGDPLFYVLDKGLRDHQNAGPINPKDKQGSLTFNGEASYAAVLFAPGPPLDGQVRDANADLSDYLEGDNHDEGGANFKNCGPDDATCNDRAVAISVDELFERVQQRAVSRVATELREFYQASGQELGDKYLPYAADFGSRECEDKRYVGQLAFEDVVVGDCTDVDADTLNVSDFEDSGGVNWLEANEWFKLIVYHVDKRCSRDQQECYNPTTLEVDGERVHAVVAASGRALAGQSRPGSAVADYLEHTENQDGDLVYVTGDHGGESNDVVFGIDVIEDPS